MAKKKKSDSELMGDDELLRLLGSNVTSAKDFLDRESKRVIIPVSPAIDYALGGGLLEGYMTILYGKQKIGKTSLAIHMAAKAAMNPGVHGKRKIFYLNIEGRFKKRDLLGHKKILPFLDDFHLIESTPEQMLSGADFLKKAEIAINSFPGCVIIVDSFSTLISEAEKESELDTKDRSPMSLVMSKWAKRVGQPAVINNVCVIGIAHVVANLGTGPSTWSLSLSSKINYQQDNKLHGKYIKTWNSGEKQVGQEIFWGCDNSALGPPGKQVTGKLMYNYGIDEEAELLSFCSDFGLVTKGGSWYTFPNGEKSQGDFNAANYLRDNQVLKEELEKQVRELLEYDYRDTRQKEDRLESDGPTSDSGKPQEVGSTQEMSQIVEENVSDS